MARAPFPAADDAAASADDAGAAPAAAAAAGEMDGEPTVVLTVLKAADGTLTLETGDEPEEGAEPMAGAGQTFSPDEKGIGRLMTAILDLVDPQNGEGPESQAQFQAGFAGDKAEEPAPAA